MARISVYEYLNEYLNELIVVIISFLPLVLLCSPFLKAERTISWLKNRICFEKFLKCYNSVALISRHYQQKQVKFYPSTIGELPRIMKKLGYQLNTAGIGALQNFMDMEINFCQHFKPGDCTTLRRQLILHKQVIDRIFWWHNV